MLRSSGIFPPVFILNATVDGVIAGLLLFSPVKIDAPITRNQALGVVAALVLTLLVNAPLLRVALAPLERLAREMEEVDLLDPGTRLAVGSRDEVGRVVATLNRMLARLERERQESLRRISRSGHGGLRGMRERAPLIGATLALEQTPSGGLEVRLEVPGARVVSSDGGLG